MAGKISPRDRMIAAAADLVGRQGAVATGFSDILAASAAPRGSIYHHFPGGKTELLLAMVTRLGAERAERIAQAGRTAGTAPDLVRAIGAIFGEDAAQADWKGGCPVAAIASESGAHPPALLQEAARVLASWVGASREAFQAIGLPPDRAAMIAAALIAGLEGGLLLARALGNRLPYQAAVAQLARSAA